MENKDRFIEALKATGRSGVDAVLVGLEKLGFLTRRLLRAFMARRRAVSLPIRLTYMTRRWPCVAWRLG